MGKIDMQALMRGSAVISALGKIKPSPKASERIGKMRPRKLWTRKMEREYERRWQIEYIDRMIREEWDKPIDWDKINPTPRKR